jgi:hypothetical protein
MLVGIVIVNITITITITTDTSITTPAVLGLHYLF